MVGVNQVIMLALNMVIISSMIGAGGLGYDVLLALRALKIGQAMEAGLAIVALAIALDRLSQAAAMHRPATRSRRARFGSAIRTCCWRSRILAATTLLAVAVPGFRQDPACAHLLDRARLEGGRRLGDRELLRCHRALPRHACSSTCSIPCAPSARDFRGSAPCSCSACRLPAGRRCGSRRSSRRSPPSAR